LENIIIEQSLSVATIWLNRPDKHNALNALMIQELTDAFVNLSVDPNIRVIVLRGRGKSFCAGADLNYMKEIATYGEEENIKDAIRLATLFATVNNCPKPVIALLHGAVYGGANGLAAACDIVLAVENTVFSFSEVKIGLAPATISPYVLAKCGEAAARDLMLTGRSFDAKEAEKYSLVNKVTTDQTTEETLKSYCIQLLSAAPGAITQTKKLIRKIQSEHLSHDETFQMTAELIARQRAGSEGQEGLTAFLEKRKPNWFHKI
jgi:methylglutaconyl-CoA hydratase